MDDRIFREGKNQWSKLRKKIIYHHGPLLYIQTWEVHQTGWPHVNLALSNTILHQHYSQNPETAFREKLADLAESCGFGRKGWLEPLRDRDAMAGYLVKLCNELTGAAKKNQVPVNAPKNFRRLRASVGLLPPVLRDEELTGQLVKSPLPGDEQSCLDNTGISGGIDPEFGIENRGSYTEKLGEKGWVTEGLD